MAYIAPAGIPNPGVDFGFEINRASPTFPSQWWMMGGGPTSVVMGWYYIDNTDPAATDSGNPFGHPDVPRRTIPYMGNGTLPPGDVVYVHAGTYNVGSEAVSSKDISSEGTTGSPIWIMGNESARPTIQVQFNVGSLHKTSFVVIENFLFTYDAVGAVNGSIDIRPTGDGNTVDHVLVRNCYMRGNQMFADTNGISIGGGTTSAEQTSYVVIYNCDIADYGLGTDDTSEQAAVYNDYNGDHYWILNNTFAHVGADCVAGSHSANDTDRLARYLFIGRNNITCGGENCIDLKSWRYVVISQNTCHGHALREQGWAIVIHSGSVPVPVRDCAIIFNTIYDTSAGIFGTSTAGTQNVMIVGNVIYNVRASYAVQPDPLNGYAISMRAIQGANYIVDNTIYDCDNGIDLSGFTSGDTMKLHGNVINGRSNPTGYDLRLEDAGDISFVGVDYGFWPSTARIGLGASTYTLAQFKVATGQEVFGLSGDPLFNNPSLNDLTLQSGSPCIDSSVEGPVGGTVYDAYFTLFGVAIEKDRFGNPRPFNLLWDRGAYEFGAGPGDTDPVVTITAPADGSTYTDSDSINFTGTAIDAEDGNISADIEWTSSLNGVLGTGASITVTLTTGDHVITAGVTDSDDNVGSDSIGLTVTDTPPPPPPENHFAAHAPRRRMLI